MRRKPGATIEETIAALTPEQRKALRVVTRARDAEAKKQESLAEQMEAMKKYVADAIEAQVPVQVIADMLGVTRGRVYQMRDEARETQPA